jgi:predicted phage tail protein
MQNYAIPTRPCFTLNLTRQFNGSIPKIACSPRGRVIRVPDNYDPETRQYSGIWTGAFKWAWTDNPAWIFYDLIVSDRFGLGIVLPQKILINGRCIR